MKEKSLHLQIISPSGFLFDGEVHHASFPGELGPFAVYPLHAPIISSLKKGNISFYLNEKEKQTISIESGFVEINDNLITVCVEE